MRLGAAIGFCASALCVAIVLLVLADVNLAQTNPRPMRQLAGLAAFCTVVLAVIAYVFLRRWSPRLIQEQVDAVTMFEKVSNLSSEGHFVKDLSGKYLMVNTVAATVFGLRPEQLLGRADTTLFTGEDLQAVKSSDAFVIESHKITTFEMELTTALGERRYVVTKRPLLNRRGEPIGIIGVSLDITARRQAEEELRIASIAFETQEGIFVADREGRIMRANAGCCRLIGVRPEEIVGRLSSSLYSRGSGALLLDAVAERVQHHGYWQGELLLKRSGGGNFVAWVTISAVRDEQGEISHVVHSFSDLTLFKKATREIHRLAYYDTLTKLPNRRRLEELIAAAVDRCTADDEAGAVILINVDNFKHLNDTRGHSVGDQLLVVIANRLSEVSGPADTVTRLGSDEFVIVIAGLPQDEATRQVGRTCERLAAYLTQPVQLDGGEYQPSVSFGIAVFVGGRDDSSVLLRKADMALHEAKRDQRGSFAFFEQNMEFALKERGRVEADLQLATTNGELGLYFQPQFDRDLQVVGAEALARWNHPTRGVVPPTSFIPVAEESGLILSVGRIILSRACAQLAAWQERGWELTVAVNVSARQFRQVGFAHEVRNAVRASGADPSRLKIELTESMVLEDVEGAIRRIKGLRADGIRFALDDFGTGYSSLSYLTRLPVDELKIDRSFVTSILEDENHALIADSIISLASGMGLRVVAEGVETLDQFEYLRRRNCDVFQGYHFGRPVAAADFADAWLKPATRKPSPDDVQVIT